MAFIRIDKKKDGEYLRIVENKREGSRVVQTTMYSLGRLSDYKPEMLKRMGEKLYALGGGDPKELLDKSIQEQGRYNYGYFQLIQKLIRIYGIDQLLARIQKKHRIQFDMLNTMHLLLAERLHEAGSKRRNYLNQEEYLGISEVALHHIYRLLDYLAEESGRIQKLIFSKNRNLFNNVLDVVFYDATTFYFDSEEVSEDGIRQKGFGKDGKIGKTQVVFGLLIDKDKNPVCYQVYRGDTYEGKTIQDAVSTLKKQYQIGKVVVVADRGMLSEDNREWIMQTNGYEFIMGDRIKNLAAPIQTYLLDLKNYQHTWVMNEDDEDAFVRYCILEVEDRSIIATYSQKRADKDRHEREEKLAKAEKLLKNKDQLKRKASRYFIKQTGGEYLLDTKKIEDNEKYDGFLAITTNSTTISPVQALDQYRHLFTIEHTFRCFKSHLEIRPMFHWTNSRIEGHICLCYIAYSLLNHTLLKINEKEKKYSYNDLRRILDKMQLSLVTHNKQAFYLRSKATQGISDLTAVFGLPLMPNMIPKDMIINYLQ